MIRYPIAKNGIFRTVQGEGALLGTPMVFVRLAGCSIGCANCDTDYRVHERLTGEEIRGRVLAVRGAATWIWITGGEPADHSLWELLEAMRLCGHVALATSGTKAIRGAGRLVDFLSISPHGMPDQLVLRSASQINLVPGLNGLRLEDWKEFEPKEFRSAWVTPRWDGYKGEPVEVRECVEFVQQFPSWRLGIQAHQMWGLP